MIQEIEGEMNLGGKMKSKVREVLGMLKEDVKCQ